MAKTLRILSLDCETTGVAKTDQVIQLAYISLPNKLADLKAAWQEHQFKELPMYSEYFNPSVDINPEAFKVHKLTKEFLNGFRPATEVELPKTCEYLIAHNAPFDYRMLQNPEGVRRICTIKLTKEIEKIRNESFELDNYQLGTVFKKFYPELFDKFYENKHNAIVDCYMSTLILLRLMEKFPFIHTLEGVWEYFFDIPEKPKKAKTK